MSAIAATPTPRGVRRLPAYAAVAHAGLRQEWASAGAWLGRGIFYGIILLIFSRLWAVVFAERGVPGYTAVGFLWYLALTEWVTLSTPPVHLDIEADVRSGDVVHRLPRPLSYLGARLAEAAGAMALRMLVLGAWGLVLARVLAGAWPSHPAALAWALPLGVLAAAVQLVFVAAVGVCAFWLHDAAPVYWIWQKAAFVLGGLLLPLDVYPAWLQQAAYCTPFAPLLHGVGRTAFGVPAATALDVAGLLVVWGAAASLGLALLYRRALRALDAGGG